MNLLKNHLKNFYELIRDEIFYLKASCVDIVDWIRYRTTRRYHIVDTKLEPGYHELDTKILHANFEMLVDFVEIEKAWLNIWSDRSKYNNLSWFTRKFKKFRSPEDGIDYLNWEITETHEAQAKSAQEVLELYFWWKKIRPERKDPFELSQFDKYFPETLSIVLSNTITDEQKSCLALISKIEQEQYNEDTDMLVRLIKIRNSLWT